MMEQKCKYCKFYSPDYKACLNENVKKLVKPDCTGYYIKFDLNFGCIFFKPDFKKL